MKHKYNNLINLINNYDSIAIFCLKLKYNKKSNAISKCFDMAYRDCGQGYRFEKGFFDKKNNIKKIFLRKFENYSFNFSRNLIEDIKKEFHFNKTNRTSYGAAQKLVNMFFKYMFLYEDFTGIRINAKDLDCPLDSIILSYVEGYKGKKWTQIKDYDEYAKIQDEIKTLIGRAPMHSELYLLSQKCGNLAFDFVYWPKGKKTK